MWGLFCCFFPCEVFFCLYEGPFGIAHPPPKTSSYAHGMRAWVRGGGRGWGKPQKRPHKKKMTPHIKKAHLMEKIKCSQKEKKMPPHEFFSRSSGASSGGGGLCEGGCKSRRTPRQKMKKNFATIWGDFLLLFLHVEAFNLPRFSPCGDLFVIFSPCGGGGGFFVLIFFCLYERLFGIAHPPPKTSSCAHGVGAWVPTQFFVRRVWGRGKTPKNAPIRKNDCPHEKRPFSRKK